MKGDELVKAGDVVYVKVVSAAGGDGPKLSLEEDSGAQASLMAVDNSNGEVLAMVGGRDFATSQFNARDAGAAAGGVVVQALCVYDGD